MVLKLNQDRKMKLYLKDYLVEDKEAQKLAYDLPAIAIFSSAPKRPGAVIKQSSHIKWKNLRSRHVEKVRIPV